ncbi:MAG: hypothetical protein IV100_00200 [Myxococcales bacterium]|nr:hypothetical protein [Myxococcales bacterium]
MHRAHSAIPSFRATPRSGLTAEQLRATLRERFPKALSELGAAALVPGTRRCETPPREALLRAGAVTEVMGTLGSGGTSALLDALGHDLQAHPTRYAVYVDLEGTFYPPAAAQYGVPLDRLLLVRPFELAIALRVVEVCLLGGAVRTVVLDVPASLQPLRLPTYHRLRRRVREGGTAFVVRAREHSVVPADHRVSFGVDVTFVSPSLVSPSAASPSAASTSAASGGR